MFALTLKAIADAAKGTYFGPEELLNVKPSGIVTDSRKVEKNCIYAAIKGERNDGHDFIKNSIENGALCAIAERKSEEGGSDFSDCPYILVKDTGDALRSIAELFRLYIDAKVIGITGSVGKTSTKETIACVLSQKFKLHKTEGNFNNQLGVPLTIFGTEEDDEVLVMEMGVSHFGDMDVIGKICRPDISVITNIADCHLENLITRDGVLKEKTEIFKWMPKHGKAILNGDDEKLSTIEDIRGVEKYFCGIRNEFIPDNAEQPDFVASEITSLGLDGVECTIYGPGEWQNGFRVRIPVPGRHMVHNAVIACAVAYQFDLSTDEIIKGLSTLTSMSGRGQIINTAKYRIFNDCYNANPASMNAALNVLKMAEGRKVAVLGDMFELGENKEELHKGVGYIATCTETDVLVCIGSLAKNYEKGAIEGTLETGKAPEIYCFDTKEDFISQMDMIIKEGDTILVKASHGMHLEKVVEAIQNEAS